MGFQRCSFIIEYNIRRLGGKRVHVLEQGFLNVFLLVYIYIMLVVISFSSTHELQFGKHCFSEY